jgi:hypothetical protein
VWLWVIFPHPPFLFWVYLYIMKLIITEQQHRLLIEQKVKGERVVPGKFVVHKSNPIFRDSISSSGLKPSLGDCYLIYADSNYEEDEECVPAIFATDSLVKKELFDSTYDDDIWVINTEVANVVWYKDAYFDFGDYRHIVTFEPIPANALTLVYKGTGDSDLDSIDYGDEILSW